MSLRENAEETYELLLQTQLDLAAVQKKTISVSWLRPRHSVALMLCRTASVPLAQIHRAQRDARGPEEHE